jgi:CheY-like chemotaxis protein
VDDDPRIVEMLSTVATDLGYTARGAQSAEALEIAPFYHPDVVLLDMRVPGMPGQQVLQALHQMERDLPVIVLTGTSTRRASAVPSRRVPSTT